MQNPVEFYQLVAVAGFGFTWNLPRVRQKMDTEYQTNLTLVVTWGDENHPSSVSA